MMSSESFEDSDGAVPMFYCLCAAIMLFNWLADTIISGRDSHSRNNGCFICTRPTILPTRWMVALLPHNSPTFFAFVAHGTPIVLLVAAINCHNRHIRFLAAIFISIYQLVDSSLCHSHRDVSEPCLSSPSLLLSPSQKAN